MSRKRELILLGLGILLVLTLAGPASGAVQQITSTLSREPICEWFDCDMIATKAIPEAAERICALENHGFSLSYEKLVGAYDEYENYYVLKNRR